MVKGISFDFRNNLPSKRLIGDPTRLRQICLNILANAIKFTEMGYVICSVTIVGTSKEYCSLNFEFKDSGIGMSKEQMEKIFKPFVQADASISRKHGGTGLGLALTKELVKQMGGDLQVESAVGIGSKFWFTLRFKTELSAVEPTRNDDIEGSPQFKGEILVVEDNEMNQGVICEHLKRAGVKTIIAENGVEAVEAVKKRIENNGSKFDLIFMDIYMPEMNGFEASKIISDMNIGTPIVAMTANMITKADEEAYKESGIEYSVNKPFTKQELWRTLSKYLESAN